MAAVFISYAHEDEQFVERLRLALQERGREVWSDKEIEPADRWKVSAHDAIDRSDAVLFVVSVASLASVPCRGELAHAADVNKRLIAVCVEQAAADVDAQPEAVAELSWIMMRPSDNFDQAIDRVLRALDVDLDVAREHTRILVRARAWELAERRASPLLRGEELRAAEDWLSRAAAAGSPPTELQREFIRASRDAATRRQRIVAGVSTSVAVVAIALSIFAFIERSQARHEANVAQSHALAADATVDLASDPQESLELALRSTELDPSGSNQQALRLALAQAHLRMTIQSDSGEPTLADGQFFTQAAWNPSSSQLAVTGPHGSVELWDSQSGRLLRTLSTLHSSPVSQLLYDRTGDRLVAVSAAGYITMWHVTGEGSVSTIPTTQLNRTIQAADESKASGGFIPGEVTAEWDNLSPDDLYIFAAADLANVYVFSPATGDITLFFRTNVAGEVNGIVPSPDGSHVLVNESQAVGILDLATDRYVDLIPPQGSSFLHDGPACWLAGGKEVATSTTVDAGGPVQLWDAATGRLISTMQTPSPPLTALACSSSSTTSWTVAGDAQGNVVATLSSGAVLPLAGDSDFINDSPLVLTAATLPRPVRMVRPAYGAVPPES